MSKRKLITSLVAMILLVAMTVTSLVSCSGGGGLSDITDPGTTTEKPAPEEPEEDPLPPRVPGELELETVEECQEIMVRYLGEASVTATGSIIKHVEAVVHPDDAPNKAVEWSIAWAEGATRASEPVIIRDIAPRINSASQWTHSQSSPRTTRCFYSTLS